MLVAAMLMTISKTMIRMLVMLGESCCSLPVGGGGKYEDRSYDDTLGTTDEAIKELCREPAGKLPAPCNPCRQVEWHRAGHRYVAF